MTGRSLPEWVGATPDAKVPPRVKLRVFERYDGRCYLSDIKINPGDEWDVDHIKPLSEGGEHRESNLSPALKEPHKAKTKAEAAVRKKVNRTRKKHLGLKPKSRNRLGSDKWKRKMDGSVVRR